MTSNELGQGFDIGDSADPIRNALERENRIAQEVTASFGVIPQLFKPEALITGMAGEWWSFAKSAYVDDPLPPLFKERLFLYLSRFCANPYPMQRHGAFLIGIGRPAGNARADPQTVEELKELLCRPLPDASLLRAAIHRLEKLPAESAIPQPGDPNESDLFNVLAVLFVSPEDSSRARIGIKAAYGEPAYGYMSFLMTYIHSEHYWTDLHPGLTLERDIMTAVEKDENIAKCLLDRSKPFGVMARQQLAYALDEINQTVDAAAPKEGGRMGEGSRIPEFKEIKRVEKTFLQSEERFRVLIDAIPQVIWANDGEGFANYFNKRWYDFSGLTFEESAGLGWQAIVHRDDAGASVKRWQEAMRERKEFETEYRLRRADGVYRWFIGRNVPLLDAENRVLGWFGTATDIEDLKTAEASLRTSTERLRITMESASDYVIITLDVDGNITSWSKGAQATFGYTEEEVRGKYGGIIFTAGDRESGAPEREIRQAASEGRALDERWHLRKDGTRFYMSGVMAPIVGEGALQGFVKVARDLTDRKLMEQLKDDFIGIASHELKTPVTSIKGYAQILRARSAEEEEGENAIILQRLNIQIGRLTTLIENLLDTTRISEDKLPLFPQQFQLNDLIREKVEDLQGISTRHRLVFRPGNIEEVIADKERIGQVLTNLLSNAIKYSPSGGEVTITSEPSGRDALAVTVVDRGIGIPSSARDKIFDRFFRVNNPQMHTFQGMGLGLYIAAGIVNRHKGSIFVEDTQGGGSTFRFILPYATR